MTKLIASITALILIHSSAEAFHHAKKCPEGAEFRMGLTSIKNINSSPPINAQKRIVFVRHGCTYMNEHLSKPGFSWGSPNFSDIFPQELSDECYLDSKLSPQGLQQAKELAKRIQEDPSSDFSFSEVDLFVLSPLTRAIQTYELGILPNLSNRPTPTMALPLAAERLYLISDIGRPRSVLEKDYGDRIDFRSGFRQNSGGTLEETWWFDERLITKTYEEWRPNGENQSYACPGEPDDEFEKRMQDLYQWLSSRKESTIAVVCHWGVINWMLDADFENCEYRIVDFNDIQPPSMKQSEQLETL